MLEVSVQPGLRLIPEVEARLRRQEITGALSAVASLGTAPGQPLTVAMCGVRGGEGVTTVTAALAAAYAEALSMRVMIATFDGAVLSLFAPVAPTQGEGKGEVVIREIPGAQRRRVLSGDLGVRDAQLILVDAGPVLESVEAPLVARHCDGVILVCESERTTHSDLVAARRMLDGVDAKVLGLLTNKRRDRLPNFIKRILGFSEVVSERKRTGFATAVASLIGVALVATLLYLIMDIGAPEDIPAPPPVTGE
jgi:Mrp family chromosome partitioning ATPase